MNWYKTAMDILINKKVDCELIVNQLAMNHPSIFVKIYQLYGNDNESNNSNLINAMKSYSFKHTKIETIKWLRDRNIMPLKESKEFVEKYCKFVN